MPQAARPGRAGAPGTLDRRRFIEAALATGAGALAAGAAGTGPASAATVRRAATVPPAGSDLGAVEHVIFLMQENRSFDHYYGSYRGVRGFDDHAGGDLGAFSQPWPGSAAHRPAGHLLPFHLDTASGIAECTFDLTHNWMPQHLSRNGGAMDAFVKVHTAKEYEGAEYGTLTMGYYTRADLPYYYALADAFTICDGYHCSVLGPTHPNRLMQMSGTIDPEGRHGGPVVFTNTSDTARFSVDWPTMPEVLEDAGISWKVYSPAGPIFRITFPGVLDATLSVLPYFSQYSDPSSPLSQKAFTPTYPAEFVADIAQGTLPQVSWIMVPPGYEEHPPAPPALGEWVTDQVLGALVANPEVWSKTVLFHTYDENDGFFDHVPPPVAPPGTPGEYLTATPLPSQATGLRGPIGLGFRVPMLVISPFSRGGYVCSETFDHTSQLRFLEERFGVRAPNISEWRRRTVGDLTATLDMGHPDPKVPRLPSTADDAKAVVEARDGCETSDLVGLRANQPPYPVPAAQRMPAQEPGPARRLASRST